MARHIPIPYQGLDVQQGSILYDLLTSKDEKERAKAPGHLKDVLQRHDKLAGLNKASSGPVAASKPPGSASTPPVVKTLVTRF